MEAQQRTVLLQGKPETPYFAIGGSGYSMTQNKAIPMTWRFWTSPTNRVVAPQVWTYLRVELAGDLNYQTFPTARQDFPVIYPGTDDEHFGGVFPLSELNNLTAGNWYVARLSTSDSEELALCPFYVIGGV
jgi:hypothetical protein